MRYDQLALGATLAITLGACSIVPQRYQLTAAPLEAVPDQPSAQIDKVHALVQDSQTKCAQFVNSMFAETAGTSLGLDVLSTITSALATVFTPLSATHALSAASTIFSGSKTGITAEYLNSLSISHVSQAIGSTYTSDMSKYISSLSSVDPTTISAYAERSKILSYHNECSLAAAEGSITSALQPSNTQTTQIPVSYTVNKSDTTTSIAAAIAKQIDGNTGFTGAGVTATNSTNIVILKMTTPLSITVTVTPSGHTTAVFKPGPPATITISGTPQANDVITVALPSTAQSSGSSTTAPAAVTGVAPAQK